jgi:peptidoglycan hydrolase-like protein with peptidoglycan-binding domain
MRTRSSNGLGIGVALAIAVVIVSGAVAFGQSRPRYSSSQNANRSWTVPEGTIISVRMDRTLSSRTARVGDAFTATVAIPVHVNGNPVIPAGSIIEGRVTEVTPAKRMSKSGTIAVDFDDLILPSGLRVRLIGSLTSDDPGTQDRIDEEGQVSGEGRNKAVFVGAGGAIGAVIGGMAGGGVGAVIGGVAGAGAGVAGILLSKGEEAQVSTGSPFGVQLRQPLTISEGSGSVPAVGADRDSEPPVIDKEASRAETEAADQPPVTAEPPVRASEPAPALPLSSPEMIRRAQTALRDQGYYEGDIDGQISPRMTSAMKTFQREHNLAQTGDLDPATANALGIMGSPAAGPEAKPNVRVSVPDSGNPGREETGANSTEPDSVLANVLSATANRNSDGSITVVVNTQANTGGWRWFGDHVINGDTLEVFARAIRPTGVTTQVITRGRIELNVDEGVRYVRRVLVHSLGPDLDVPLRNAGATPTRGSAPPPATIPARTATTPAAANIQRQAEELLSEYQRLAGIRLTGSGIQIEPRAQRNEDDIELLFTIDSFANAAQLYARLLPSIQGQRELRSAALSLAREARQCDRIMSTASSQPANALAKRWDAIRQEVLKVMQAYRIDPAELD